MCVTEWLSVREGRRRAETESTETSERELKMRRMNRVRLVRVLLFQPKWCILHPFFFFRISTCIGGFSQNRWFWIQPNQHELVQFRTSRKKKKNWMLHECAGSGVPHTLSCWTWVRRPFCRVRASQVMTQLLEVPRL